MLSAINSVKFTSANNYKRTYANTSQSAVNAQPSFCASAPRKLTLIGAALLAVMPSLTHVAEGAASKAGKAKGLLQLMPDAAAKVAKKAVVKEVGPMKCKPDGFKHPENALERRLIPIRESLRIKLNQWGKAQREKEFMGNMGMLPEAEEALAQMVAAAERDGIDLKVESGYQRSYRCGDDDGIMYVRETEVLVNSGNEVTINDLDIFRGSDESKWVFGDFEENIPAHAERFGFEPTCMEPGCDGKTLSYNPDRNLKSLILNHGKTAKISMKDGETAVTIPTKDGCTSTYYFTDKSNFATHVDEGRKWEHKCHTIELDD